MMTYFRCSDPLCGFWKTELVVFETVTLPARVGPPRISLLWSTFFLTATVNQVGLERNATLGGHTRVASQASSARGKCCVMYWKQH